MSYSLVIDRLRSEHASQCHEGARLDVKTAVIRSPTVDMKARQVRGLVTTTDVGIDGLIVPGWAFDTSYFHGEENDPTKTRAVYWNHEYGRDFPGVKPIGKCVRFTPKGEDAYSVTYLSESQDGEEVLRLINEGIVNGISSGFRTREYSEQEPEEMIRWRNTDLDAVVIRDALLLEYSIVAMPACPTALIERSVKRGMISNDRLRRFGLPTIRERSYSFPVPVSAYIDLDADTVEV